MNSIEQTIEDLRVRAEAALAKHPDETPLDPVVPFEQALREWYQLCDEVHGQILDDKVEFRMGQHVSRVSMMAVLEALAQCSVSREQMAATFLQHHERARAIHEKVGRELGYNDG